MRISNEYSGRIDLLLTDILMPKLSGRELAAQVATVRPDIRVLYMSGYTADATIRSVIAEAHNFIAKPFSPTALLRKVREVLNKAPASTNHQQTREASE